VHDAVAVAHLAVPNLLALVHAAVDVELGDLARGRTITDWYGDRLVQRDRAADVDVAVGVNADRFDAVLVEAILSFK
jgi:inosine-uridine nucleoside N-ribohydrolase